MTSCKDTDVEFLDWLSQRAEQRPSVLLEEVLREAGGAKDCAIVVVDLIEGFCRQGPLASPLIEDLIQPTTVFLKKAHELGVSKFYFPCDAHDEDSPEFRAFPPHCLDGSEESKLVRELPALGFSALFRRFDKRSISSLMGTTLGDTLQSEGVKTIVCTGDCTDLCLYHLAVGLRFLANSLGLDWQIIVPQNLVATYDLPLEAAKELDALPHPAGFLSKTFLYHLELNGVRVVTLEL